MSGLLGTDRRHDPDYALSTIVAHIDAAEQSRLIEDVRGVLEQAPLVRPRTPNGAPMRVRVSAAGKLGWVGDGAYRYDARQANGRPWPPMPEGWAAIATDVAGPHAWDSAIVNWYDDGASLGWHRDQSEHDRSLPIVTISLGDAASWAIREDDQSPIHRCRLESGDVTLLARNHRNWLHSIERIIPCPLLSPLRVRGRISITIRVAGTVEAPC